MRLMHEFSAAMQTRLIAILGVGSLLLIFVAGQISGLATDKSRQREDNAIAAIEAISQARFDISLISTAGTRYLDSLDEKFAQDVARLSRSVSDHLDLIREAMPDVADRPEYTALSRDLERYEEGFARASDIERGLGSIMGAGLRRDFILAAAPVMTLAETEPDPKIIRQIYVALLESHRIMGRGANVERVTLVEQIRKAIEILESSRAHTPQDRQQRIVLLRALEDRGTKYIDAMRAEAEARAALREISRSASDHFLGLASHISRARSDLRAASESTQRLIDYINLTFSALVALAFVLLARAVGRRARAQADAIGRNEARFRQFVEMTADFAAETDADMIIRDVFVRPSFVPGAPTDHFLGQRMFADRTDLPYQTTPPLSDFAAAAARRESFSGVEYQVVDVNGRMSWRRAFGAPYEDGKGVFAGYRFIAQDMTAMKQAEQRIRESEAVYRAIATASFAAFYRLDREGRIIVLEGLRNQPQHLIDLQRPGRFIWDVFADLGIIYPADTDLKARVLAGQPFDNVEVQTFTAEGVVRGWFAHRGVPVADTSGTSVGYVIAVANFTKQKVHELEARLKGLELERIIATMPGAFFRLSGTSPDDAVIEYASPRAVDILGYTPEEIINRPGFYMALPESMAESYFGAEAETGAAVERRVRMRRKDGSIATVIQKPMEIKTRLDGRRIVEGLLIDISDLAQRDDELAKRSRQLEAVVSALPGWIYGFSFKDGRMVHRFCSDGTHSLVGWSNDELLDILSTRPQDLIHPDDLPRMLEMWARVRTATQDGRVEHRARFITKDGRFIAVSDRCRYKVDADGTVHVDGIILDIDAEAAALEQNEIIKSAIEAASDAICVLGEDRKGIYANAAFRQLAELAPDAAFTDYNFARIGRTISPHEQTLWLTVSAALAKSGRFNGEQEWESPAGRRYRLETRITRTDGGNDVMIIRDVTALRAEAEHRSRLYLAAAQIGVSRGVFFGDLKAGIRTLTRTVADALNVARVRVWLFDDDARNSATAVDVYDRRRATHGAGDVRKRADYPLYFAALDLMRNIIAEDAVNNPITREFSDSDLKPAGISGLLDTPIFRGGKVLGVLCIERDGPVRPWLEEEVAFATVTADSIAFGIETNERQLAERQVIAVNNQLKRVVKALDSSRDHIIIEEEDGRVSYLNAVSAAKAAVPYPAPDGRLPTLAELFPNFNRSRLEKQSTILADLDRRGFWEGDIDVTTADSRLLHFDARIGRLPDGGLICAATDITDRKQQAREEIALRAQLAEAQKMEAIGRLAGGIAHDFNNFIAAIAAFSSVIADQTSSSEQRVACALKIKSVCGRASDIVRQILLFAKAKTATHEPLAVADVLSEAHDLLTASLPAAIEVRIKNTAPGTIVVGSVSQLLQVLMNLGLNAGDAIDESTGYIELSLDTLIAADADASGQDSIIERSDGGVAMMRSLRGTLAPGQRYARLAVRDNGPGIPQHVLERIYEPFFSTKEKSKGSGLGIPVVSSIVSAHHGAIEISTRMGYGTRFAIYLPISDQEARPLPELTAPPVRMRARILIVDDESDLADALSMLLTKAGFETAPVYSPDDALSIFAEDPHAWDLVITDQVMPKMKGVALAKRLLKIRPGLPIILHTGYSDSASEESVKAVGIRALVFKPVEGPVLVQYILAALNDATPVGHA